MLYLAGRGTMPECEAMSEDVLENGKAFDKFKKMVREQGGDTSYLDNTEKFKISDEHGEVLSEKDGYIYEENAHEFGKASVVLGAGRVKKSDTIDYGAGIKLERKPGDRVKKGDVIARVYASSTEKCREAMVIIGAAVKVCDKKTKPSKLIKARITENEIKKL